MSAPARAEERAEQVVLVEGLAVRFGEVEAVAGISFDVSAGEAFGLLGPNGAGKTTTIRVLTTLLKPGEGTALVAGHDVVRDGLPVRQSIGYVPQAISIDGALTAHENLEFYGRATGVPRRERRPRIEEAVEAMQLGCSSTGWAARCPAGCCAGSRSRPRCSSSRPFSSSTSRRSGSTRRRDGWSGSGSSSCGRRPARRSRHDAPDGGSRTPV